MFFKEEYIENYDFSLNKFTLVDIVNNFLAIVRDLSQVAGPVLKHKTSTQR